MTASCYHCGLPVPARSTLFAVIDGVPRPMCCGGCQAVAETIAGSGLAAYYRSRTAVAARQTVEQAREDLALYDLPELQHDFV